MAFLMGAGVTTLLQSSTATGLMLGSFSAAGMIALAPALAVMLGANVGTTLTVQFLSLDVSAAAPVLLLVGVIAFKRGRRTRAHDLGRVAIGLGLMLLSLHTLLDTLAPAENAPAVQTVLAIATREPVVNLLLGAVLAWAAHSSIAVVLLVTSLGYSHFVSAPAALALVLGANLGTAINPALEGGSFRSVASRRLAVGNLVTRAVGCALFLPLLDPMASLMVWLDPSPIRQVADFHTFFNVAIAALFIVPLYPFARLLERLMPGRAGTPSPAAPLYLDPAAIETPSLALTCAAREALHMGDIVETMLRRSIDALMTDDRKLVAEVERMDNAIDKLHEAIKLYVTQVTRESLDDREGRRAMEIISFTINLEHIGDIIDKNLMELAAKKIKGKLRFSEEGAAELRQFHGRVLANLKLAFSVFISGDVKVARKLIEEKVAVREDERAASDNHFARLRDGRLESIETSSLHLDILRDLKRIHSHLCAAAYPVLETTGELQPSRLRTFEGELVQGASASGGGTLLPYHPQ
jgi:phosphate:Na+ symporter